MCWLIGHNNHINVNKIVDHTVTRNGFLEGVEGIISLKTEEVVLRGHAGCVDADIDSRSLVLGIGVDGAEGNDTEVNFAAVFSVSWGAIKKSGVSSVSGMTSATNVT